MIVIVNEGAGVGTVCFEATTKDAALALIGAYVCHYEGDRISVTNTKDGWSVQGEDPIKLMGAINIIINRLECRGKLTSRVVNTMDVDTDDTLFPSVVAEGE